MRLHSLRLFQSLLLDEEVLDLLGSSLLDPDLKARVGHLASSAEPSLRLTAQQTLEDLQVLQQVTHSQYQLNFCSRSPLPISKERSASNTLSNYSKSATVITCSIITKRGKGMAKY